MMEHRESTVLFYNVSKKSNSGPIVRSAGAFGVSKIFVVGDARSNKIKFGAQGTHTRIPFEFFPKLKDAVQEIKSRGFAVYGVEIDPNAVALDENPFRDERICFMFGNEGVFC
jgi:tRNA G18 (ribose-2'-O)-methylase SpoU